MVGLERPQVYSEVVMSAAAPSRSAGDVLLLIARPSEDMTGCAELNLAARCSAPLLDIDYGGRHGRG